jgi:hypothetical protein
MANQLPGLFVRSAADEMQQPPEADEVAKNLVKEVVIAINHDEVQRVTGMPKNLGELPARTAPRSGCIDCGR